MNVDVSAIVDRARLEAAKPAGTDGAGSERARLEKIAQEFESMLLVQVLRGMRTSGSWEDEESGGDTLGAEAMYETLDVEMASHLARVQGLGLSKQLLTSFDRMNAGRTVTAEAGVAPAAPGVGIAVGENQANITAQPSARPTPLTAGATQASPLPVGTPAAPAAPGRVIDPTAPVQVGKPPLHESQPVAEVMHQEQAEGPTLSPVSGRVTSDFGWRRDPFTGRAKFHKGVDLRAAYGEDVNASGEGRVVFSGQQGAYGTTVLIEHPDGTRTRYAHLSVSLVRQGDAVGSGQPVGRAGRSGRATGTHVHFEVLDAKGRPMDPEMVMARHTGHMAGD